VKSDPVGQLEHEIELTRQDLDQALRALQVQLSPRYQLQRAWKLARSHPLPLLGLAATLLGILYLTIRRRPS
jgi:hypothetical protein